MSLFKVFDVAGSAMGAQNVRLNTVASNLANVDSVSGDPAKVYKPRDPVFSAVMNSLNPSDPSVGVKILGIADRQTPPMRTYEPGNPLANKDGYVYQANISPVQEMANMISASRNYQNNVEVFNTTKQMLLATLRLGE